MLYICLVVCAKPYVDQQRQTVSQKLHQLHLQKVLREHQLIILPKIQPLLIQQSMHYIYMYIHTYHDVVVC